MLHVSRSIRPFAALIAAFCAATAHAQSDDSEDSWSYELIPYLWASAVDGRIGVNSTSADVSASFKDLIEFRNVGFSMRMTATRDPIQWYGEASYVQLENDTITASGPTNIKTTQTLAEVGLSYDFTDLLAAYAGVRYQDVIGVLQGPSYRTDDEREWLDGYVGLRWNAVKSDRWSAWLRGDVGAGGSKFTWLAEAGGGYHWGSRWAAYLAYRVLDTDYEHDGLLYDVKLSGLLLGFGARL
jgi:hypothetical protein